MFGGGTISKIMSHYFFNDIISIKNLCDAWSEFVCGKRLRKDTTKFSLNLSHNIFNLHKDLQNMLYQHGCYESFSICDPKPRSIHKATVRDRLLHHAVYRVLYPHFNKKFIYDSYSCIYGKGIHKAIYRFNKFMHKASRNDSRICWVLKCDIKKFFANIDHQILIKILEKYIVDKNTTLLLNEIIGSFYSTKIGKGLPLGNLTSQLLVNIYMNEFDQYIKHDLKIKYYIRFADDFVILSNDKTYLVNLIAKILFFLQERLKLELHPNKVFIKTVSSGVDFLGWVNFSNHKVLRTSTKKRMFRNIKLKKNNPKTIQSYLGMLKHGNTFKIKNKILYNMRNEK